MVTLSQRENEVVRDLTEGLALAVNRHPDLGRNAFKKFSKTKLNKIYYYAIQEFSLPVTYSWYLAGAHIESEAVSIDEVEETYKGKIEFGREINNRSSEQVHPSKEYAKFFSNKIDDVWFTPRYEFLRQFYEKHAPKEYRNLYLRSLDLRILMNDAEEELETIVADTGQTSFSQFGVDNNNSLVGYTSRVVNQVQDIEVELASDDELSKTLKSVGDFFDIVREVFYFLEDEEDLTREHLRLFSELKRFYFMNAWQYPCLFISKNTAAGPGRNKLINNRQKRIAKFEVYYEPKINKIKEDWEEAGCSFSLF